ncbi:hypothetical protein LguiA_007816 [Lonicera macranthoides]
MGIVSSNVRIERTNVVRTENVKASIFSSLLVVIDFLGHHYVIAFFTVNYFRTLNEVVVIIQASKIIFIFG